MFLIFYSFIVYDYVVTAQKNYVKSSGKIMFFEIQKKVLQLCFFLAHFIIIDSVTLKFIIMKNVNEF